MKYSFETLLKVSGIPEPKREHVFSKERKWAFDYAWPEQMIALESDGSTHGTGKPCHVCGQRKPGGHSSRSGIERDMKKINAAQVLGWIVLRCTPEELTDGYAQRMLEAAFAFRRASSPERTP